MGSEQEPLLGPDERRFFEASSDVRDADPADGDLPEMGRARSTRSARDRARTDREYEGRPLRRPIRFS